MADSFVKTYTYDNGEIQRVQAVMPGSFDCLNFLRPGKSADAFVKIVNLYRNFIVPKAPWVFGRMVLFTLPQSLDVNVFFNEASIVENSHGLSREALLCDLLQKNIKVVIKSGKPVLSCKTQKVREICDRLIADNCLSIVCGKLVATKILPVGSELGLLSENMPNAEVKVNSHFFIMDCFDVNSIFDRIGTPIGLMVKNGEILNPPLYDREAFLVYKDNRIEIRKLKCSELTVQIGSVEFKDGINAHFMERPEVCRVKKHAAGIYVVIVGNKVEAVLNRGGFCVPSAGFVIRLGNVDEGVIANISVGDRVEYRGLENVKFGLQVGNSVVINGVKTTGFVSKFYDMYHMLGAKAYPPSLYPLDYNKARAPRIVLGADRDNKPVVLWAEGPKKTGYIAGEQSCGASLGELADIAADMGLVDAVNLDGGGSAQILYRGKRLLTISDRNPQDDSDAERAVPVGLYSV